MNRWSAEKESDALCYYTSKRCGIPHICCAQTCLGNFSCVFALARCVAHAAQILTVDTEHVFVAHDQIWRCAVCPPIVLINSEPFLGREKGAIKNWDILTGYYWDVTWHDRWTFPKTPWFVSHIKLPMGRLNLEGDRANVLSITFRWTNQICYGQLSQVAIAQSFLFVRGATLATRDRPL